jgi:hypothetical protein
VVDFADGLPTMSAQGRAVLLRDSGNIYLDDGGGTVTDAAGANRAWYSFVDMGRAVTTLGAEFSFIEGDGGKSGAVALIPWTQTLAGNPDVPPTSLHLVITRWTWTVGKFETLNGPLVEIATGYHKRVLEAGERYSAVVECQSDLARLTLPDGSIVDLPVAAVGNLGKFACVEAYQFSGADDDRPLIYRSWFGTGTAAPTGTDATGRFVPRTVVVDGLDAVTLTADTNTTITGAAIEIPQGSALFTLNVWIGTNVSGILITPTITGKFSGSNLGSPSLWLAPAGVTGWCIVPVRFNYAEPSTLQLRIFAIGSNGIANIELSRPLTLTAQSL